MNPKRKTMLLGLLFLGFLGLAYVENLVFYGYAGTIFFDIPLAILAVFVHNVLVISLILLSMTFYVGLVVNGFFTEHKYEGVVLEHPRVFAFVFTVLIIVISMLRASMLVYDQIRLDTLAFIILLSLPNGILEGLGIFLTLQKTFKQSMRTKDLFLIYGLFLVAAVVEVGFINGLRFVLP